MECDRSPAAGGWLGIVLVSPVTGERVDWGALDAVFLGSEAAAFSPDGRRLAYTRTTGDFTGQVNIVGVGADGRPVGGPTTAAVIAAILERDPPALSATVRATPALLDRVVRNA